MEDTSLDELRRELAVLQAQEARLSGKREHLHRQIDFGFETGTSREREREVSDERRRLHERIDEIRELLRARETA
jgi:50S ribosomal subunit-associated GTPase HflX